MFFPFFPGISLGVGTLDDKDGFQFVLQRLDNLADMPFAIGKIGPDDIFSRRTDRHAIGSSAIA